MLTWCIDAQDALVPLNGLHSQRLILAGELNLSVAGSLLVPQKNEHLHRALPNRQHGEVRRDQSETAQPRLDVCLTLQGTLGGTTTTPDLMPCSLVDCVFPAFPSDPDGFLAKGVKFAAEADTPTTEKTFNL